VPNGVVWSAVGENLRSREACCGLHDEKVPMPTPEQHFACFRAEGRADALAAVFDALAPELLLVAAHLARGGVQAEDLVQATFVDAIRGAARWDETRALLPWLLGILARNALAEGRRAARQPDPLRVAACLSLPADGAVVLAKSGNVRNGRQGNGRQKQ